MNKMLLASAIALAALVGHVTSVDNAQPLRAETTQMAAAADPDRGYVEAVGLATRRMVALCKKEITSGRRPEIVVAARKILTIEQENQEYLRAYEAQFNITHSP